MLGSTNLWLVPGRFLNEKYDLVNSVFVASNAGLDHRPDVGFRSGMRLLYLNLDARISIEQVTLQRLALSILRLLVSIDSS